MSDIETKTVKLPGSITVRDLASEIDASPIDVIKTLMANGVMANINQIIDFDTAAIVATEMGFEAILFSPEKITEEVGEIPLWRKLIADEDTSNLVNRPPVITILGHVDHGKTTLLDAIRHTDVATGEAGGITQHIGAYQVVHNKRKITFLDTPGHAAFTAMRARGAQGADIVVLVVAADDGVMPQTKEAIDHSRAAKVPILVALNKMDRPNANPKRASQQLAEAGLVPDDWDGDTIVVPISAKKKEGLEDLLEAILLVADNMDIRANPSGDVIGTIVEAKRDRERGVLVTLLVQNGTVNRGDMVVAGTAYGKIRALFDHRGQDIPSAGPSTPVSVMGFNDVPDAGDIFQVVESERQARILVKHRKQARKETAAGSKPVVSLEQLFEQFNMGTVQELRLVIKADVQGSLEPINTSLEKLSVGDIKINILRAGTGNIGENDVMLALASKAVVIGFNVQVDPSAKKTADLSGISIRLYEVIYRLVEDVEKALNGMLEPEEVEVIHGKAEVRALFRIPKVGNIAGCRVTEGIIRRNMKIRVHRGDQVVFEGEIRSLKHEKDDVNEAREGFECGIAIRDFKDVQVGDRLESFSIDIKRVL